MAGLFSVSDFVLVDSVQLFFGLPVHSAVIRVDPSRQTLEGRENQHLSANLTIQAETAQTWNELPQPHDLTTFGLLKTKPRFSSPS